MGILMGSRAHLPLRKPRPDPCPPALWQPGHSGSPSWACLSRCIRKKRDSGTWTLKQPTQKSRDSGDFILLEHPVLSDSRRHGDQHMVPVLTSVTYSVCSPPSLAVLWLGCSALVHACVHSWPPACSTQMESLSRALEARVFQGPRPRVNKLASQPGLQGLSRLADTPPSSPER